MTAAALQVARLPHIVPCVAAIALCAPGVEHPSDRREVIESAAAPIVFSPPLMWVVDRGRQNNQAAHYRIFGPEGGRETMNKYYNIVFVLLVTALSGSKIAGQMSEQGKAANRFDRQLFEIKLRPEAVKLLEEVEKCYGKPIREERRDDWASSYRGEADVDSDGSPVIRLNRQTGMNETTIVHELCHLKFFTLGFPKLGWSFPLGPVQGFDGDLRKALKALMFDSIQHSKFYPEMRKMGYDPDVFDRRIQQKQMLISRSGRTRKITTNGTLLSAIYLKAYLESSDREYVAQLEQWYKQNNLDAVLEANKKLVTIVETSKTDTPEQQVDVFVRCLNFLLRGAARFQAAAWGTEKLSDKFARRTVTIQVLPPE